MKVKFILVLLFLLPIVVAQDLVVWQGQYYESTEFQVGTFDFNFTIYDAKIGGGACYSNTSEITTGNFGEWSIEQAGVGTFCNDPNKFYYLEIAIDNNIQTPRRLLKSFDYIRSDAEANSTTLKGALRIETNYSNPLLSQSLLLKNNNLESRSTTILRLENDVGKFILLALGGSETNISGAGGAEVGSISYSGGNLFAFNMANNPAPWVWRHLFFGIGLENVTEDRLMELLPNGSLNLRHGNFNVNGSIIANGTINSSVDVCGNGICLSQAITNLSSVVNGSNIINSTITTDKLVTNIINSDYLAQNSVNTSHIANGTIRDEDLGNISSSKIQGLDNSHNHDAANITSGVLGVARGGTEIGTYSTGDLLYAIGPSILTRLAIGSSGQVLTSNGTDVYWSNVNSSTSFNLSIGGVNTSHILDGAIIAADIANGVITATKLVTSIITSDYITTSAVNTSHILDGTIRNADLSPNTVNTSQIIDNTITGNDISTSANLTIDTLNASTVDIGLETKTAQCSSNGCTATATCTSGKVIIYGFGSSTTLSSGLVPSAGNIDCTSGATSCGATDGELLTNVASVKIVCAKVR